MHFIKFIKFLSCFKKTFQKTFPVKLFTMLLSCLNLYMYSTYLYFSSCMLFIIFERDSVNDIYGYFPCKVSCIDWEIAYIIFKGLLIILSYLGCSLILYWIWLRQNSLNIITYIFLTVSSSFSIFSHYSQFVYSTLIWRTYFLVLPWLVNLLLI